MRIGIDIRLQNETGVGRYIRNLSAYLPKIAPQHEFIFLDAKVRWHSAREQFALPKFIKDKKLDLIHFPYFSVPILYKEPFVVTIHDLIINSTKTGMSSTLPYPYYLIKRLGYNFVLKHALENASAIIVPSKTVQNDIVRRNNRIAKKIHVTYEGADDLAKVMAVKKYDKIPKGDYFLYVGNAYPRKNLDFLISSFIKFISENKLQNLHLVMVGKIDYLYRRLADLISKLPHNSSIHLVGYVTDSELVYLYKHARGLIIPSLMEGFCLPIVESLSMKKPVLASDIAVFHELYKDSITYFNPHDKKDLITKLSNLIYNYDREEVVTKIQKGVKLSDRYRWEETARQTLAVYENCLSLRSNK